MCPVLNTFAAQEKKKKNGQVYDTVTTHKAAAETEKKQGAQQTGISIKIIKKTGVIVWYIACILQSCWLPQNTPEEHISPLLLKNS